MSPAENNFMHKSQIYLKKKKKCYVVLSKWTCNHTDCLSKKKKNNKFVIYYSYSLLFLLFFRLLTLMRHSSKKEEYAFTDLNIFLLLKSFDTVIYSSKKYCAHYQKLLICNLKHGNDAFLTI